MFLWCLSTLLRHFGQSFAYLTPGGQQALHPALVAQHAHGGPPEIHEVEPTYAEDPHNGMHPALYALVFGIVSGLSLPIGSAMGIYFSPVSDKVCAMMMAFGAGALLFAVTVELYGHALAELIAGRAGLIEMFTTIIGAIAGAAFYLWINRWLEEYLANAEGSAEDAEAGGPTSSKPASFGAETSSLMSSLRSQKRAKEAMDEIDEEEAMKPKRSAKDMFKKAVTEIKLVNKLKALSKDELNLAHRGRTKALRALSAEEMQHAKGVALALFLGLLVDGVPEGILMGFLSAEGHLTAVLIVSLFIANFPEAFSSASLLIQADMSYSSIVGMWTGLCILVGSLGGMSCYLLLWVFPKFGHGGHHELPLEVKIGIALVEGFTGGAMIACISAVMLPEAFERADKTGPISSQSGFLCTLGFLFSVALKAVFG